MHMGKIWHHWECIIIVSSYRQTSTARDDIDSWYMVQWFISTGTSLIIQREVLQLNRVILLILARLKSCFFEGNFYSCSVYNLLKYTSFLRKQSFVNKWRNRLLSRFFHLSVIEFWNKNNKVKQIFSVNNLKIFHFMLGRYLCGSKITAYSGLG